MNKLVNTDLKYLVNWLNANKMSLNIKKTEIMIFKFQQNKFKGYSKIKLCCKRVYPPESFKYLGVKNDTNLSWQFHTHNFSITLNRAKALLFKIRKHVSLKLLRSIYFAIFDSYLPYCCFVWPRDSSLFGKL